MSLSGDDQVTSPTSGSLRESDASSISFFGDAATTEKDLDSDHTSKLGSPPRLSSEKGSDIDGSSESGSKDEQTSLNENQRSQRRRWQAQEISLAQSFNDASVSDLNSNLIAISAERKRIQSHVVPPPHVRSWQSRYRWVGSKKDRATLPPTEWTAWPLEPLEVPGNDEWHDDIKDGPFIGSFWGKSRQPNPNADLEEIICDIALENYRKRWGNALPELRERARKEEETLVLPEKGLSTEGLHPITVPEQAVQTRAFSAPQYPPNQEEPNIQVSEAYVRRSISPQNDGTFEPVFSADDERSHRILQPSARNIISKIDALLLGLSQSRSFHEKGSTHASSPIKNEDSDISLPPEFHPDISKLGSDSDSGSTTFHDRKQDNRDFKSDASRKTNEPNSLHGLRDWSDVLGMASLTGWKPEVVARAAKKCALLFGEEMAFTTFTEGGDHLAPESIRAHSESVLPSTAETPWTVDTLRCPHLNCPRSHGIKFSGRHRLVEHIKRTHKWDPISEQMPVTMVGGVHVDGFLQPIHARQGWRGKDEKKSELRGVKRKKTEPLVRQEIEDASPEVGDRSEIRGLDQRKKRR
jgi:hypothetical protein